MDFWGVRNFAVKDFGKYFLRDDKKRNPGFLLMQRKKRLLGDKFWAVGIFGGLVLA